MAMTTTMMTSTDWLCQYSTQLDTITSCYTAGKHPTLLSHSTVRQTRARACSVHDYFRTYHFGTGFSTNLKSGPLRCWLSVSKNSRSRFLRFVFWCVLWLNDTYYTKSVWRDR